MKIGLHVPQVGHHARPDVISSFARAAEDAGFDSLWVFDHVVLAREQGSAYPYSPDGRLGFNPQNDFIEALTLMTHLAAVTSRVQIGSSVLVVPMRQPVYLAKVLASMDRLSGGRIILGAGVGWWEEEFEVLGRPFDRRGARFEEELRLMHALWHDDWVDFHGEFYQCVDWTCNPKPVNGTVTTWLGGESRSQLRRAGQYADGWLATAKSLPSLASDFAVAQAAAEKAGRDPAALALAIEGAGVIGSNNMREAAERLAHVAGRGVDHAICIINPREIEGATEIMGQFAAEHLAALHSLAT
jgi:probable F420-dependent oxidoreductase